MIMANKRETLVLFLGDVAALIISLSVALMVRYGSIPSDSLFVSHLIPFSFLFAASILVYFVAGLYEKRTLIQRRRIGQALLNVQITNAVIAIVFFYFLPYFDISPKLFLFIYLILALILTTIWRLVALALFESKKKHPALLIARKNPSDKVGQTNAALEIYNEINNNPRYGIFFVEWIDAAAFKDEIKNNPQGIAQGTIKAVADVLGRIRQKGCTFIAADLSDKAVHPIVPALYKLIFSGVEFVDTRMLYEDLFNRIPLSLVDDAWCLENISASSKTAFDILKRTMDVVISAVLGVVSLIIYPFVYAAIKLDDKGVIFSYQRRVGQNGHVVKIMKFRTMSIANDDGKWGLDTHATSPLKKSGNGSFDMPQINTITRVGTWLRKSRIDELPQLWSVLRGDISLIGPRPEFPDPVATYIAQIPYYNLRHIVKPGLSGWAQIYHENHPHHGIDTEETANKLSYDLYYVKNRSFFLDLKIALQTMKVMVSFAGK
jgi:lipopolysaccharide/colanic/teichoic acid biosynthesis glycosyltransferase